MSGAPTLRRSRTEPPALFGEAGARPRPSAYTRAPPIVLELNHIDVDMTTPAEQPDISPEQQAADGGHIDQCATVIILRPEDVAPHRPEWEEFRVIPGRTSQPSSPARKRPVIEQCDLAEGDQSTPWLRAPPRTPVQPDALPKLRGCLGRGSFGTVYEAEDVRTPLKWSTRLNLGPICAHGHAGLIGLE